MARASKKNFIVETATGVFLKNGYKGTSIGMVVTACQVSKPTVYNHFPDKSVLMDAVLDKWMHNHPVPDIAVDDEISLWTFLAEHWWTAEVVAMYRMVIGEGWRFEVSAQRFWQQFDEQWRAAAKTAYAHIGVRALEGESLDAMISHRLWLSVRG